MEKLSDITIFEQMNPLIKEGMSNEQKRETKRLINKAIPKQTQKILNLNFDFWFFKMFYITIYMGREKRSAKRRGFTNLFFQIILVFISTLIVLLVVASVITAIFLALYYIKSLIGMDLFEFHLLR